MDTLIIVYGSPEAGSPNNWAAIVGWLGLRYKENSGRIEPY
jgi:hypothetical protein